MNLCTSCAVHIVVGKAAQGETQYEKWKTAILLFDLVAGLLFEVEPVVIIGGRLWLMVQACGFGSLIFSGGNTR